MEALCLSAAGTTVGWWSASLGVSLAASRMTSVLVVSRVVAGCVFVSARSGHHLVLFPVVMAFVSGMMVM